MSEEHVEETGPAATEDPNEGVGLELDPDAVEFDRDLDTDDIGFGDPTVMNIIIGKTAVDPHIQRKLVKARVNDMVARFNRNAIGIITVNRRKDGRYYLVDGQHRRATMIQKGLEDEPVTANVFDNLTKRQEAVLFELLNATNKPNPVDIFKARLVAGHRPTRHMFEMLRSRNWIITLMPGEYRFAAVRTLENIYRQDPEVAERTIHAITEGWKGNRHSMDYRLLSGISYLLGRYGELVSDRILAKKLSEYPGGPAAFIAAANSLRTTMRNSSKDAVAFVLVTEYNKGEREANRLPTWDARKPS